MRNKSLLPILLLAAFALGACNPGGQSKSESKDVEPASSEVQPSSQDDVQYGVEIANKAALQGEWYAGTNRDLDVTLSPAANPLTELGKNLTITSSDAEVVKVTGLGLSALKAGQATITVKYHDATDTVAVTILDNSAKAKYGVAHEGTAEDPFTNEDALVVAKHEKYEKEVYYVKGIVDRFYYAPGTNANNGTAFYLKAAQDGGEQFEIFKCFKEDGSQLSDDDIWVGGEATVYGAFTKYNSQYETSSAVFVSCTGTKPEARKILEKSFAETLAAGVALADGDTTWDYYKFTAFVSAKEGNNFWLTATKGEALVKGKSDEAHGSRDINTNAIELYNAGKVSELAAKLLDGAEVEVTMLVKNYHGTVENGKDLVDADVTVKTPGAQWAVPEPAVGTKTLAEFIALENSKAKAYNVTAEVKSWKNATADKDKYGNMVLTDGTNDLVIYGASATATALAWDNSSAYAFTNPQDFLTNEVTAALNIGDTVTMKLIRADYTKDGNTTIQGSGIITNVVPAGTPVPTLVSLAKYTFTTQTANNTRSIDATVAKAVFTKATGEDILKGVSSVTNVYEGGNGGSGDTAFTIFNILKIGKSKTAGEIKFTLKQQVSKIVIVGAAWTATASITINGTKVDQAFSENIVSKATIVDGKLSNPGTLSFEFAASKEITISVGNSNSNANFGVVIESMEFFGEEGGVEPDPVANYPTFKWDDALQDGALDGTKFNKNATYNLKVENVPAAGNYTITLPMMGSDGNSTKTFCTSGTDHDGQGFSIFANDVEGEVLVAGKTYEEVFGADQKVWVDVVFGKVALNAGTNIISIKTNGGGYRVSVKADGNVTLAEAPVEIAQPTGAFRGLAKTAAGSFIPVDMVLAADSVALSINGAAATVTSYAWNKTNGTISIVTDGDYGTISASFAENVFTITGLTGAAAAQLDLTFAVQLSGNCQFIDCGAMTLDEMNAMFVRRYDRGDGNGWQINNPSDGRISAVTKEERAGLQCNGFSSGKVGFTLKADLAQPIPGSAIKSVGCWIYNPGETSFQMKVFAYKSANRATNGQLNTFTIEPGWHFYQTGVVNGSSFTSSDSFYNFQFYYENVSVNPVFDDLCIYM